jgi:hypothetical protein
MAAGNRRTNGRVVVVETHLSNLQRACVCDECPVGLDFSCTPKGGVPGARSILYRHRKDLFQNPKWRLWFIADPLPQYFPEEENALQWTSFQPLGTYWYLAEKLHHQITWAGTGADMFQVGKQMLPPMEKVNRDFEKIYRGRIRETQEQLDALKKYLLEAEGMNPDGLTKWIGKGPK